MKRRIYTGLLNDDYLYSDKFLLNHLKELTKKLGRTPGKHDINKAGKVTYATYHRRFGNLIIARKAAGLVKSKVKLKYSDKYLLDYLKELAKQLGRTPEIADINKEGKINSSMFNSRFGGIKKAQKEAGLKVVNYKKNYSDEELILQMKVLAKKLGRVPAAYDINKAGKASYGTYHNRFGSLKKIREVAGLENTNYQENYSDEDLINHLKDLAKKLGRTPGSQDIDKGDKASYATYFYRFGSLKKAHEAAGLKTTVYQEKYSDEELIRNIKVLSNQLGRMPRITDITNDGKVAYHLPETFW